MLPGTAFGVLVRRRHLHRRSPFDLARRSGRDDVSATASASETVSLFGLTFGALGLSFG
jgi:hypothetical protein